MARTAPSAVLDSAHVGDIEGALGRINLNDTDTGRTLKTRLLTLLAIVGPGLIVMVGDNDAGGVATYAQAGQNYGYSLLWVLLLLDAVAALWPERTATFHLYMELLWQSRVEDDKPVPAMEPVARTQLRARRANAAVMGEMTQVVDAEEHRRDQETDAAVARYRSRMS